MLNDDFPLIPANNRSLAYRKLICGVGINDAWYMTNPTVDNIKLDCPIYRIWKSMISRAYSKKYHDKQPTYVDVSVCNEWLSFMEFRKWILGRNWEGLQLDKDLKVLGNKIYSPHTCIMVTNMVNNLFLDAGSARGNYPIGVCKHWKRYRATVNDPYTKKANILGSFDTPLKAHMAYKAAKNRIIWKVALGHPEHAEYILNRLYL